MPYNAEEFAGSIAAPTPTPAYPYYNAPSGPSPNPTNTPSAGNSLSGFGAPAVGNQYPSSLNPVVPTPAPQFPDANTWMKKMLERRGIGQLDSRLRKLRSQAIINWGDPSLAQDAGFNLDPTVSASAYQNTVNGNSVLSRLQRSLDSNRKSVIDRLASQGILFSGDLGYGMSEADKTYGNQQYAARQDMLAQLESYLSDYMTQKSTLEEEVRKAYETAYSNFLSNPSAYLGIYDG